MRNASIVLLLIIGYAHSQETQSYSKYWLNLYAQKKVACHNSYIAGTLQGVDCFSTTMDGLPTCCNVKCPEQEEWFAVQPNKDGSSPDVIRHITNAIGKPYHQRCTNDGLEAELTADGFLRCEDTFTNRKTGTECKVNPDSQRGFVCRQKK